MEQLTAGVYTPSESVSRSASSFRSLLFPCSNLTCSIFAAVRQKSGRPDSNRRPPAPKAGALAKLRYAPRFEQ